MSKITESIKNAIATNEKDINTLIQKLNIEEDTISHIINDKMSKKDLPAFFIISDFLKTTDENIDGVGRYMLLSKDEKEIIESLRRIMPKYTIAVKNKLKKLALISDFKKLNDEELQLIAELINYALVTQNMT